MKKVTSKDGTLIAYDQSGSGTAVILVDGALCSRNFGPMPQLAALLAEHFTVINYDRRGRNESSDTKPYAVSREVEDIEALIDAAGGSAYLVGVSSGAALSIHAAAKGLNINRMVLYEPPYMVDEQGHHPPMDSQEQLKTLIAEDRRGDAVKFFMRDMVGVPSFIVFMMSLFPIFKKLKAVAHTLPYDAAVLGNWEPPVKEIASIKIPVLISGGEKSPVTLRNAVQQIAGILPNSELKTFKGQDHNISMKVFAPVVMAFLNK